MDPNWLNLMKPTIAEIQDVKDRFVAFIKEREQCRFNKMLGIVPHTADPILAVNKFCNVNREHDAVTVWVKDNVRDRTDLTHPEMVKHLLVARVFNNPSALQHVIPFTDLDVVAKRLNALRAKGQSVFRGAYMMVVHGDAGKGKNAIDFYCNLVRTVEMMGIGSATNQLADVANLINSVTGLGRFMANQIVTDLRYTAFYPMATTKDWRTFVWEGPGTLRGVMRFFEIDLPTRRDCNGAFFKIKAVPAMLLEIRQWLQGKLDPHILDHFNDINNLSNCFCEFDKYERVLNLVPSATGRKATLRKYNPN